MENEFLSTSNKELLWGLLFEEKVFENIPSTELNNIQKIFENNLLEIDKISDLNLIDRNKKALIYIKNNVETYKIEYLIKLEQSNNNKFSEIALSNKQKEFEELMQLNKPDEVNFGDEIDEPFDKLNMENILEKIIQQRNQDFNQISSQNSQINKINIGDSINLEENIIDINTDNKKVQFNDNIVEPEIVNENVFLNNLKKIESLDVNDTLFEILERLKNIEKKLDIKLE